MPLGMFIAMPLDMCSWVCRTMCIATISLMLCASWLLASRPDLAHTAEQSRLQADKPVKRPRLWVPLDRCAVVCLADYDHWLPRNWIKEFETLASVTLFKRRCRMLVLASTCNFQILRFWIIAVRVIGMLRVRWQQLLGAPWHCRWVVLWSSRLSDVTACVCCSELFILCSPNSSSRWHIVHNVRAEFVTMSICLIWSEQ